MTDPPRERFPVLPGLTILERLGGGAVGTVYLARQEQMGRLVAVKVLRRELAKNRLYLERLRREARLSARLDHPNVVKGLDLGEVEDVPYFIMEFVDGKSLKTVLRERGRLEEEEVLEYGLQLARGLDHAYRHGVVHRDIKPANLLIARDGTLKLTDLGLARRPDDSSVTKDGVILGTPHYFSPEQARDPAAADVRSDLYSVGATLFHAATGRPPFDAETVAGVLSQVLDKNLAPQIPDDTPISKNLALVIRRLLAKDPNRRYQTPDDLLRDLERVRRRERPDVSVFDINPKAKKHVRTFIISVCSLIVLGGLLYGVAHLAGGGGEAGPSAAARAVASKLRIIEKETGTAPSALADRWSRLQNLLRTGAFTDEDRVRAMEISVSVESQLSALVAGLERACEQDLAKVLAEKQFAEGAQLLEQTIPGRFREPFSEKTELLPPKVLERIQKLLEKYNTDFLRDVAAAEGRLMEALPRFLSSRENESLALLEQGHYKSALALTENTLQQFETDDGLAWLKMPHGPRERIAEPATRRMNELRTRILESARDSESRLAARLRREHDLLEEALRAGQRSAVAAAFEEIATRALDEEHYLKEEWPQQVTPDPEKIVNDFSSSLHSLERQHERDVADRAFAEHESQLAPQLRDRRYITVRDAWRTRIARAKVAPVKDKMERRAHYADLLIDLRERARLNIDNKKGKKIQVTLRSGGAVAGKVVSTNSTDDEVIIKLTEGTAGEARFSVLAAADIITLLELSSSPEDRFLRGVFWMAENELDRAQAEFVGIRGGAEAAEPTKIENDAEIALLDIDAMRAAGPGAADDRDRRYEDALKSAKSYESIGESQLARLWLDRARQEAQGFAPDDSRVAAIDKYIKEFEEREKANKLDRGPGAAFPGAEVRRGADGRLDIHYTISKIMETKAAFAAAGWERAKRGILYDGKSQAADIARAPAAKLTIPVPLKGPVRASFNIYIPNDDTEGPNAPRRAFTALGRTVIFANPRSRGPSFTLLRAGGAEGAEIELEQLIAQPETSSTIGLLRGCVHDVTISIEADQRSVRVLLDGQLVAKGDIPGSIGENIELRANAPLEWRGVTLEGVTPAKR
ncbi:MAG: serine/threonine protein kinase [Planctomycetes bacterium]|nr:serine/threonine protein kinase [Planctomycetota bacterium]